MKTKHIIGGFIVIFWLITMGFLIRRNISTTNVNALTIDIENYEIVDRPVWMSIYMKNQKIGYSMSAINKTTYENKPAYIITEKSYMRILAMGTTQEIDITGQAITDYNFICHNFNFSVVSGLYTMIIEGKVEDKKLHLTIHTGGKTQEQILILDNPLQLASTAGLYVIQQTLPIGKTIEFPLFEPTSMSMQTTTYEILDKENLTIDDIDYAATKVKFTLGQLQSTMWLDEMGRTLKEEMPGGMMAIRESKEKALQLDGSDDAPADLLVSYAVPADKEIPNPRQITYCRLQLSNIELPSGLEGDMQKVLHKTPIIVEINSPQEKDLINANTDNYSAEYLEASIMIQSDNEEIIKQAQKIIGDTNNAWEKAQLLNEWVFENLNKIPTFSIPSALDILKNRSGDCNEHTTLYVALARAVDIPSRIAVGVVYLDGSFYYHAWPEIWLNNSWIPLEPTFGQSIADATHLRLASGGLDKQIELLNIMGKMQIKIINFSE